MNKILKNIKRLTTPSRLKNYLKIIKREKVTFIIGFLIIIFWTPLYKVCEEILDNIVVSVTDSTVEHIDQQVEIEKNNLLSLTKEIVDSNTLQPYIAKNDVLRIITLVSEETDKHEGLAMTVVNKEGIALSRTPMIASRGDYTFQTIPWGRVASRGESVATFGAGRNFPISIVAAQPILNDSSVEGAIYAGYWLDDKYAKYFKDKYLSNDINIAFYSTAEGVSGSTFDSTKKDVIKKYFNSGTDFIRENLSNFLVKIDNEYYFVKNIQFDGLENSKAGGVLVFLPRSVFTEGIVLSLIISVLVLALSVLLHYRNRKNSRRLLTICVLIFLTLIIFIISTALYVRTMHNKAFNVEKIPQAIYNSVLRFEPELGIVDMSVEQSVAIRVVSGGESINVVEIHVQYEPESIKVNDIITTNSFCDPETFIEKTIDNDKGEVVIICGKPNGFDGEIGTVANLLIEPLRPGEFHLRFDDETVVLANDGLGTDVLRQSTNASFTVLSSFDETFATTSKLILFSRTHPNSERWYNSRDVYVSWSELQNDGQYIYSMDKNPEGEVSKGKVVKDTFALIKAPSDGTHYVHVAPYVDGVVGPITTLEVNVDSTPPKIPTIKASNYKPAVGEVVRVEISSSDDLSGLQKTYYYKIDEGIRLPLGSELSTVFQSKGTYSIKARAFDNAGNLSDSSIDIVVE